MSEFRRYMDFKKMKIMKESGLFKNKLFKDIECGDVLPALRGGYYSFYYKSGGIFEFRPIAGFKTHRKYAGLSSSDHPDYVNEDYVKNLPGKNNFSFILEYEDVKKRCASKNAPEADAVSVLYKYNVLSDSDVILLDTEVCFPYDKELQNTKEKKLNRIDVLFYKKSTQTLVFCEVKMKGNSELGSGSMENIPVVKQVLRYENLIKKNESIIIDEYKEFIKVSNNIFDTTISEPLKVFKRVGLLVVGENFCNDKKSFIESNDVICNVVKDASDIESIYNNIISSKGNM